MISSGYLLVERLRIHNAADTAEIQEGLDNIRKLLDKDTNPDSRAMISFRLRKIIAELSDKVQKEVKVKSARSTALGFVLSAFENNPCYSNREMLVELKVEN